MPDEAARMQSVPQVFTVSRLKGGDVLETSLPADSDLDRLEHPGSVSCQVMRGVNLKISPPSVDPLGELVQDHVVGGSGHVLA